MCGEDLAGLNFMSLEFGFECLAGSQMATGDLSASADPTYYFVEFSCIVPPNQEPGNYDLRAEWNSNSGSWRVPGLVAVTDPAATPTTTAAPVATRCPGGGEVAVGALHWWAQPSSPSAAPGDTMLIQICGEDLAGLNSMSVELGFDCQSGSQLTSGDLSALADPTYYFAEFTCIVPPDQAPGDYSITGRWSGASGEASLPGLAIVTEPTE